PIRRRRRPSGQHLLAASPRSQQTVQDARRQAAKVGAGGELARRRKAGWLPRQRRRVAGHSADRNVAGPKGAGPEGSAEADRAVSPKRSRRSAELPERPRRPRSLRVGLLQRRRPRQRPGLGLLALGRTGLRLVFPRHSACPRVGQRGRRSVGEDQYLTAALTGTIVTNLATAPRPKSP